MKSYRFRFFRFGRSRRSTPVRGTSVLFKRFSSFEGLELRSLLSGSSLLSDSALVSTVNNQDVHESPIDQLSIANFLASNQSAAPLAANATEGGESGDAPNAEPLVDTFKAKVTVVFEDLNGNVITEIVAGRQFKAKVYATDLRTDPSLHGVSSAFVALNFNTSLISLTDPNSLVVAADFQDFLESKNTSTAGKVAAGGLWLETVPANLPDAGEAQLVWSVTLNAVASGDAAFTTSYEAFSAETELFMFGEDTPVNPASFDFQSAQLDVVTQPTVSISDVSKTETNAAQDYVFTVKLSSASSSTVTVAYATSNASATAGQDYTAKSGTLTFTTGVTQQLVTISVLGDTNAEANETFNVTLSSPTGATLGDDTGLGTIVDDDSPLIAIQSASKIETDGVTSIVFTVTASKVSTGDVTVVYSTQDGTGTTANNDYTAKSGTLTFLANSSGPQLITVTINGDEVQEADETFQVVLSSPTGGLLDQANDEATGTILNDDGPVLSLGPATVTHSEGDTNSTLVFTVSLTEANDQPVIVVYNTANGTATAGSDYTAKSGTLTFAAGNTTAQLITIDVIGDNLDEVDETFSLVLSAPQNATIAAGTSVATIQDDDVPTITFDGPASVNENSGNYVVTVKLSSASPEAVTVVYNTANGTATASSDYTAGSGTLTFAAGQTVRLITIGLIGDTNVEASETFTINLTGATNAEIGQAAFTATIANDDAVPTVEVIAPSSQNEGNSGGTPFVFTVKLSASSNETVTVVYSTANAIAQAGSDYTASSGTLTFAPGTTQQLVTVLVTGDTLREDTNETFRIDLTSPAGATLKTGASSATATIVDDDPAPSISISDATAAEGDTGTNQFLFTVTLSNPSQQTVTVKYATQDGTAVANGDYTSTSGTLTFSPNQTVQVITVNVVGDLLNEENETFSVVLSTPSNSSIADGTGTGTIQDETGDNINIVPSTISGKVFVDNNGNGAQNGMEKSLAGIQVKVTGSATLQTTTNADGTYTFANVQPGTYTVKFTLPTQYKDGTALIGSQGGTAVEDGYTVTIAAPGGVNGTGYHFATRGLLTQFLSQRMFIASQVAGANDLPAGQVNVAINTVTNPIGGANATSTTISGTGTAGALISVVASAGGTSTAPQSATVAANGTWSVSGINVLTLPDGDVTYTATATGSGTTDIDTIISKKDTVGPTVDIGTVTNPVNASNATDTAVSGTGEVGASISLVVTDGTNSTSAVTTTVGAGGVWSIGGINVSALANGSLTYTVTAKDAAGNSTTDTITTNKDSEAPALAVTTIPTTIGTNNQAAVTIGGTGSAGATITVRVSDSSGDQVGPLTTTVAQGGTWSVANIDLTSLDAGTLTATVVATDGSNNTTSVTKTILKVLTTEVTVDTIEDPANSETEESFELTGTGAVGATIKIVANDTNGTTPATTEVTVTVNSEGKWTASIDLSDLDDGAITFTVTATDTLGNTKTITAPTTKDTVAPELEVDEVDSISLGNADEVALGGSTEPGATVTIVANDNDNSTPATAAVTAVVAANGDWTAAIDVRALANGTITFTVTATDAAGNVTTESVTASKTTVTVNAIEGTINESEADNVALSGTSQVGAAIKVVATNGAGTSEEYDAVVGANGTWSISEIDISDLADGTITFTVTATAGGNSAVVTTTALKDTEVTVAANAVASPIPVADLEDLELAGTVEPGSTVKIVAKDTDSETSDTSEVTAVVDSQGNWTASIDISDLTDGTITFEITATDAAGNTALISKTATKDTAITLAVDSLDSPIQVADLEAVALAGTVEPGSTVKIVVNDTNGVTPATAEVTATVDVAGNWTATVDVSDLTDGTLTFTVTATDVAGNTQVVDVTATKDTLTDASIQLAGGVVNLENVALATLSGACESLASLTVAATDGETTVERTLTGDVGGGWSIADFNFSTLADGDVTLQVIATDAAGNVKQASITVTKDTSAPVLAVDAIAAITADNEDSVAVSGTVTPGSTVKIVANDTDGGTVATLPVTATVDAEGNWTATVDVSSLEDGTITFTVTAIDAVGNEDVEMETAEKDSIVEPLAFADGAFGEDDDWLTFFE
jgi:hypothetical protein